MVAARVNWRPGCTASGSIRLSPGPSSPTKLSAMGVMLQVLLLAVLSCIAAVMISVAHYGVFAVRGLRQGLEVLRRVKLTSSVSASEVLCSPMHASKDRLTE